MFEAQLINAKSSASVVVYSPWFSRQGDYMRATVEVINATTNCTLVTTLFSKDSEDPSNGAEVSAGQAISQTGPAAGLTTTEWRPSTGTGINELVRYRFTVTQTGVASEWILFRGLPPVWFDAVQA